MRHYDVVILGGGAAGLMCAAWLREHTPLSVAIVEGNGRAALKLKASGGGKCNLTNVDVDATHYLGDEALVRRVLDTFPQKALLEYFRSGGLRPVIRKERYYFCPKSSDEVIAILLGRAQGCDLLTSHKILGVEGNSPFVVTTDKGELRAEKVIVATGGASYKEIGASDVGLKIAQSYGLDTVAFSPALVGLTLQPKEFWMKELSGISFPARIRVAGKTLDEDLLFAHKGISGPVVLSASLYWHRGEIEVDFLPDFDLERVRKEKKLLSTALPLPKRFMKSFLEAVGLEDKPCNRLDGGEWEKLSRIRSYPMAPSGTFGLSKAEACRGGVACSELDPATMESRKVKGLYFIGETVDVTGELGGYNFQWAFSSAVVAAKAIGSMSFKRN
ncbi:aminoacetone oxidase family FAD-binding enzyme [Sulfuricurvum sp. IAE1]|jgi:predicted Rossmann fold flavoprotein|uniref:NAD(P)/FAD-dependent oxidoreductase n=1 Tax=Sulfuricurvum sp. IAE1 TaxID=2546102 RepID=UPI00104A2CB8|nr:aminoacetone oxidase family FAD-binding enzyme [Sulfuricurvum sp. IAE1]MDD3769541.1 aminoacetone oxidase family FAD-binding enzyme [Sulfuricurvum sp.]MDX9965387.1 aminoacetone oxidase family FAD-binding enzyme [Sulfuricurvum sp.]TDA62787.1 aminoacetone oxidase family FAD-binding enzyme [Sulfuricurvum sp. IAE1]